MRRRVKTLGQLQNTGDQAHGDGCGQAQFNQVGVKGGIGLFFWLGFHNALLIVRKLRRFSFKIMKNILLPVKETSIFPEYYLQGN